MSEDRTQNYMKNISHTGYLTHHFMAGCSLISYKHC